MSTLFPCQVFGCARSFGRADLFTPQPRDAWTRRQHIRLYRFQLADRFAGYRERHLGRLLRFTLRIEWYLNGVTNLFDSPSLVVTESGRNTALARLQKIFEKEGVDVDRAIEQLSEVLPGIHGSYPTGGDGRKWILYENISHDALAHFLASRRLGEVLNIIGCILRLVRRLALSTMRRQAASSMHV